MFTVKEVTERWRLSERAVRALVARGKLRHIRLGRLIRIPEEVVREVETSGLASLSTQGQRPEGQR